MGARDNAGSVSQAGEGGKGIWKMFSKGLLFSAGMECPTDKCESQVLSRTAALSFPESERAVWAMLRDGPSAGALESCES